MTDPSHISLKPKKSHNLPFRIFAKEMIHAKLQEGGLFRLFLLSMMKKNISAVKYFTCKNSDSSSVVGGDLLSKLKLKQGLGDSWKEDLGDSREKEAGERLELGVETSR